MMPPLMRHIEDHLGPILMGWSADADGQTLPFSVVLCDYAPIPGMRVLVTMGLSTHLLSTGKPGKFLRQELVAIFREADGPRSLPGMIQQLGLEALSEGRAYALGEVIGPRGELVADSTVSAFYVALPVYLPQSFYVCRNAAPNEQVVFAWLVPVTTSEAGFVRANGLAAFEDKLHRADPDLLDYKRSAIV